MLNRRVLAGLVVLLSPLFSSFCGLSTAALAEDSHVQCRLLADVSAIAPGKSFTLGVLLKIDPGWHVYWKNPGDSGLPTQVQFLLPQGFSAGDLQFPTPARFAQSGNIATFGYENWVLLTAQVTPPSQLPANFSGEFSANVSWLVCSDECIRGKKTVTLPLKSADAPNPSDDKPMFDEWVAQIPVPAAQSPIVSSVTTSGEMKPAGNHSTGDFSMDIAWKMPALGEIDFFPGPTSDYNVIHPKMSSSGNTTHIAFTVETLAGKSPTPESMEFVIGYSELNQLNQRVRRGLSVMVRLPRANLASVSN